jgi:hypothetical protein
MEPRPQTQTVSQINPSALRNEKHIAATEPAPKAHRRNRSHTCPKARHLDRRNGRFHRPLRSGETSVFRLWSHPFSGMVPLFAIPFLFVIPEGNPRFA